MLRFLAIILIYFPFFAYAENIKIHNVQIRPALQKGFPTTVYLSIDNLTNEIDSLLKVEVHGSTGTSINKTVIERGVARIIKIDRLTIPAHSTVNLAPFGIYIVVQGLSPEFAKETSMNIKLIFNNAGVILLSQLEK